MTNLEKYDDTFTTSFSIRQVAVRIGVEPSYLSKVERGEEAPPSEEKIREGVLSTRSQLLETLAREGFEPIPATGEVFDPKVHEAVSGPGDGDGDGDLIVGAELRRGYVMRGRVIRPSLVTVEHA